MKELADKLESLLKVTRPAGEMPRPYDEDRRYSDREIAYLEAERSLKAMQPAILAALRSSEADQRDAARYRWLRDKGVDALSFNPQSYRVGISLDAAIDAAMRQSGKEENK